ncbi:MAG: MAPEG family protein [Tateyamaria sp.]
MSNELSILAFTGLWTMVVILIQVLGALGQVGLLALARNRDDIGTLEGAAGRLDRAQVNSIVALALFAPAILLLNAQGVSTAGTLLAAQIFLIARIVYVAVYAAGVPWLRTGVWMAGFLSTAYLYIMAL